MKRITSLTALTLCILATSASGAARDPHRLRAETDDKDLETLFNIGGSGRGAASPSPRTTSVSGFAARNSAFDRPSTGRPTTGRPTPGLPPTPPVRFRPTHHTATPTTDCTKHFTDIAVPTGLSFFKKLNAGAKISAAESLDTASMSLELSESIIVALTTFIQRVNETFASTPSDSHVDALEELNLFITKHTLIDEPILTQENAHKVIKTQFLEEWDDVCRTFGCKIKAVEKLASKLTTQSTPKELAYITADMKSAFDGAATSAIEFCKSTQKFASDLANAKLPQQARYFEQCVVVIKRLTNIGSISSWHYPDSKYKLVLAAITEEAEATDDMCDEPVEVINLKKRHLSRDLTKHRFNTNILILSAHINDAGGSELIEYARKLRTTANIMFRLIGEHYGLQNSFKGRAATWADIMTFFSDKTTTTILQDQFHSPVNPDTINILYELSKIDGQVKGKQDRASKESNQLDAINHLLARIESAQTNLERIYNTIKTTELARSFTDHSDVLVRAKEIIDEHTTVCAIVSAKKI